MLTGTNAGLDRVILSNTATSLDFLSPFPNAIQSGDQYEIILKFNAAGFNDHITGSLTLDSGIILEIADSSTLEFDGLYSILCINACEVRLNKTKDTMCRLIPTIGGNDVVAFWGNLILSNNCTIAPKISYLKAENCTWGIRVSLEVPSELENVHNIWIKNYSQAAFYGGTLATNLSTTKRYTKYLLQRSSSATAGNMQLAITPTGANTGKIIAEQNWVEDVVGAATVASWWAVTGTPNKFIRTTVFRNNVMKQSACLNLQRSNNDALARNYLIDNYLSSALDASTAVGAGGGFFYNASSGTGGTNSGIDYLQGNVSKNIRLFGGATTHPESNLRFNDLIAGFRLGQAFWAPALPHTLATGDVTSDRDYFAGWRGAAEDRADLSAGISSTENPVQFENISGGRTNPRATRNKALVMDNVQVGTPTDTSVSIEFDSANGDDLTNCVCNSTSTAGTNTLFVSNEAGFIPEELIEIGHGTERFETALVESVSAFAITLQSNLQFTHTGAQADTVKKSIRNIAIGGVRWGTQSGVYEFCTRFPNPKSFGAIYTGFYPEILDDDGFEFKRTSHEITLENLKPATQYYFQAIGVTPLEDLMYSAEQTFTTAFSSIGMPPESDVRDGVIFGQASELEGTLDLPPEAKVEDGFTYDNGTKTGSLPAPDADDLRLGVVVGSVTGTVRVPTADKVKIGELFEANDSETGTYDGNERYTDVPETLVVRGIDYRYNSLTDNREGDLDIAGQVWNAPLSNHTTSGTFGWFIKKLLTVAKFLGLK